MLFDEVTNPIPVLGHVNALRHYLDGNPRAGNQAMYESTRTTAVMAGGALGAAGGPVGMALGGMAGGAAVDAIATIATGEPQGLIGIVDDAGTQLAKGEIPIVPLIQGTLMVAGDAAGGLAGGSIYNIGQGISTASEKIVMREMMKLPYLLAANTVLTKCSGGVKLRERRNDEPDSPYVSGGGSGGDGDRNGWNDEKEHEKDELVSDEITKFLKLFGVNSLGDIRFRLNNEANYRYPFRGLSDKEIELLEKLIQNLSRANRLNVTIDIAVGLLCDMNPNDVTFINFISLSEFVAVFIGEKASQSLDTNNFDCNYTRDHSQISILCDIDALRRECSIVWKDILEDISDFSCDPYFRNVYSAAYHYYKHRMVPGMNIELSVAEYFDLINEMLEKLKKKKNYAKLGSSQNMIIHMEYYEKYDGTVKIVVKIQQGRTVLSSCYIIDKSKKKK